MKHLYFFICLFFCFVFQSETVLAVSKPLNFSVEKKTEQKKRFQKAEEALYTSDLSFALPELALLCEQNFLKACSLLGFSYAYGRYGLQQSQQNAVTWYEKCVQNEKDFSCRNELGLLYQKAKSYRKAYEHFETGAKAGNARAQYLLGKMYYDGKIIPADMETAVKWIRRSAHNVKNPEKKAQCLMVEMSYFGIGMRPSIKDTDYWLKKCDIPFIRALKHLYGEGVEKNPEKAKEILKKAGLNEALKDWNDFIGNSQPSVGKKIIRDHVVPKSCVFNDFVFGAGRSSPKIETYAVKIFGKDYYRSFIARDGFSENGTFAIDQTFDACGITFYTTKDNKLLFNKALRQNAVVKILRYQNACLGFETTDVCNLNLPWKE